jgi:cholesterol transport system auxiliary component
MTMRIVAVVLVLVLHGCGGGTTATEPRSFDLGLEAPAARLPAVRIGLVRAIAPFDGTDMYYRLAYRNVAEIAAFANSRWAAAPATLLRRQLLRASSENAGKCLLAVEIQEFTQVFSSATESEARVELQAMLNGRSRNFRVAEGRGGADAVSGAAAVARAADRAIGELGGWIAAQPDCR